MRGLWMFVLAVALLTTSAVWGATIVVDTTDPAVADDGACSLIEAIDNANVDAATHLDCSAGSGADVIELAPASTYLLTQVHSFGNGPNGLPTVASEILIEGNGSTINRLVTAPFFRFILVNVFGNLSLVDLTLRHGDPGAGHFGGAILNYGTVRLERTTLTENISQCGGGAHNGSGGAMTLTDSVVINNVGNHGGGLCSSAEWGDTSLSLKRTLVTENVSNGEGGGIQCVRNPNRHAVLEVLGSTVAANSAVALGGGINAEAEALLRETTITGNHAGHAGGGVILWSDVGVVDRCTVSGNTSETAEDVGGSGAGILVVDGTATISNSTISGNQAMGAATNDLYSGRGGGIELVGTVDNTMVTVEDTTICDNGAKVFGGGISVQRLEGSAAVALTLRNTIIAANLDQGASLPGNCSEESGATITLPHQYRVGGGNSEFNIQNSEFLRTVQARRLHYKVPRADGGTLHLQFSTCNV